MPKKTLSRLKVIKVPLDEKPPLITPSFSPIPQLYIELLENKGKLKDEVIGKEFIPKGGKQGTILKPLYEGDADMGGELDQLEAELNKAIKSPRTKHSPLKHDDKENRDRNKSATWH